MNILFFDTETTGLVRNWVMPNDPLNPHLMQLGFTVCNEKGRSLFTFASLVKPYYEGEPDAGAIAAHGISREMCETNGATIDNIMGCFRLHAAEADLVVAHNFKFDNIIVQKASRYCGELVLPESFCTMLASTDVCGIAKKSGKGYKWPKLSEAYMFFFNEVLKDAHDALTDVMACKRVFFEGLKGDVLFSGPSEERAGTIGQVSH